MTIRFASPKQLVRFVNVEVTRSFMSAKFEGASHKNIEIIAKEIETIVD